MKKITKKLFLAALSSTMLLTLASCNNSTETVERNTIIPYGSYADLLDSTIASSGSGDNQLNVSFKTYYNSLRKNGYDIVLDNIKTEIYAKEINAINELINTNDVTSISSDAKKALNFKDNKDDEYQELNDVEKLNKYKKDFIDEINSTLAAAIFKSSSAESLDDLTEDEIIRLKKEYVSSKEINGYEFKDNFMDSNNPTYNVEEDTISFDLSSIDKDIIDEIILDCAENLYSKKELYIIADEEFTTVDDEQEENDYYYFNEEEYEELFNSTYKTYGSYNTIIIQFNNIKEANDTMIKALGRTNIDSSTALNDYLAIYKEYYKYKFEENEVLNENDDCFNYIINENDDTIAELPSQIQTLVTSTLEDGDFLVEPRNINNKYVLAYRIKTTYDVNNSNEETSYADLDETQKEYYNNLLQNNIIDANASSYQKIAFKNAISDLGDNLKIYDPLFEYRFEYTYSDEYELIDKNDFNSNYIYSINGKNYTVEEFYELANKRLGTDLLLTQIQYEFASQFIDNEDYISSDTIESNEETFNTVYDKFKNDENSTYPVEVGEKTFLLNSYGYDNKDDVLKYYYNAKSALSAYLSKNIFTEWVNEDQSVDLETLENGILGNILNTGNQKYDSLFEINVDHILINIDADADGSPDDPDEFIKNNPTIAEDFENEVVALAKAIYEEATHEDYAQNTLFENLSYIVKVYNKGETLRSNPSKTWDDYKKYNFLLTAEQLASSGNITEESVSNFVTPFADYIKGINKTAEANVKYDDGKFFFYNTATEEGTLATSSSEITTDTLCKTVYGYHLIVLNENNEPESLEFTASDDPLNNSVDIKILIKEDEDDESNNVIAIVDDVYNENKTKANINQLFVYYVQLKKGADSSLDEDIEALMSSLFDDVINTYCSSTFQTLLLLQKLNVTSTDEALSKGISAKIEYYKNSITENGDAPEYESWVDGTLDWTRPDSV